jgi:hypothetical protein
MPKNVKSENWVHVSNSTEYSNHMDDNQGLMKCELGLERIGDSNLTGLHLALN